MAIRAATKAVAVVKRMVPGKYYIRHIGTLYTFEIPSEIGSDCRIHNIVYNRLLTHLYLYCNYDEGTK